MACKNCGGWGFVSEVLNEYTTGLYVCRAEGCPGPPPDDPCLGPDDGPRGLEARAFAGRDPRERNAGEGWDR
ncbi:MAG TPA: hypothetical protein VM285_06210 [Polyangia bacterium]|nr:hypothetical protein [Polyangia bacterium]